MVYFSLRNIRIALKVVDDGSAEAAADIGGFMMICWATT